MIAILGAAILLLAFGTRTATPVVVVTLLGLVYGSIQAVCRSLFALLVGDEKTGEMFGFDAIAGRLSAALGPLLFGRSGRRPGARRRRSFACSPSSPLPPPSSARSGCRQRRLQSGDHGLPGASCSRAFFCASRTSSVSL
jgi:hypothetical protein